MCSGSSRPMSVTVGELPDDGNVANAADQRQRGSAQIILEISVPRDLAVQIVGSDAGKAKRMRPHRAMTKGAEPSEVAAVEAFMKPFFDHEIDRVHGGGRPALNHVGRATVDQALSLKKFCLRFATSLKEHLAKKGDDDRHHRSRQRFNQAWDVINQINRALELPTDDGRSLDEVAQDILNDVRALRDKLVEFRRSGVPNETGPAASQSRIAHPSQLLDLIGPLDQLFRRCATSDPTHS